MLHKKSVDVINIGYMCSMCIIHVYNFGHFCKDPMLEPLQVTVFCDLHVICPVLQVLLVVESCMEMVRVTLSSHTLLALAMNQVFSSAHLTSLLMILNVVTSKMPMSFAKVYVCTLFQL